MWKSEKLGHIASDFIDGDGYYDWPLDAEEMAEVLGLTEEELAAEAGSSDWKHTLRCQAPMWST